MVKRLRHRPFTAVTRVRVPMGSPKQKAQLFKLCFLFWSLNGAAKPKGSREGEARRSAEGTPLGFRRFLIITVLALSQKGYPNGYPFCVVEIFARSARRVYSQSDLFRARVRARAKPDTDKKAPYRHFSYKLKPFPYSLILTHTFYISLRIFIFAIQTEVTKRKYLIVY